MRARPLYIKILIPFLLISILAVLAVSALSLYNTGVLYLSEAENNLIERTALLEDQVAELLSKEDYAGLRQRFKYLDEKAGTRLTIIREDGHVVADNSEDELTMTNHADRPEVVEARRNRTGTSIRVSATLGEGMMYVARRLDHEGEVVGFVRAAFPLTRIEKASRALLRQTIGSVLLIGLLVTGASIWISRRISLPIKEVTQKAARFAKGDFREKIHAPDSQELFRLASTMNDMASQLDGTINQIRHQQYQQDAMLESMAEGVIALSPSSKIITLNLAACRFLNVTETNVRNRPVGEVVRHPELLDFIERVEGNKEVISAEITLRQENELNFRVYGNSLSDPEGSENALGSLIVLADITEIKRLEHIRRDFVANVSHELKTPTTSIIGFVETLESGAIDNREDARRFLKIINRQARRLNSIVDDLLSLSRIEREYYREKLDMETARIKDIFSFVIMECRPRAEKRNIRIEICCPATLQIICNRELLEQALLNLTDNAIKYSSEASTVTLSAEKLDNTIHIRVTDEGEGITEEHLPRLFERFYRVDKARSRKVGGTGLGLAIVKHIAQAHEGNASVSSTPGKGSTFSLNLPSDNEILPSD